MSNYEKARNEFVESMRKNEELTEDIRISSEYRELTKNNGWLFPRAQCPEKKSDFNDRLYDYNLAKMYCPRLYVDPKIFEIEQSILVRNLKVKDIQTSAPAVIKLRELLRLKNDNAYVNAIFNLYSDDSLEVQGYTEEDQRTASKRLLKNCTEGVNLWLLSNIQSIVKAVESQRDWLKSISSDKRWRPEDTRRLSLLNELLNTVRTVMPSDTQMDVFKHSIFTNIFNSTQSPTCVIKYNVVHHEKDPNLICIQYFVYWPIQIWPHHLFDYEPIYTYIYVHENKSEILAASFNNIADMKSNATTILSAFRKRPGHLIKTWFNPESGSWYGTKSDTKEYDLTVRRFDFSNYNEIAGFMTKAYSGQYTYQEVTDKSNKEMVPQLFKGDYRITLCIPKMLGTPVLWHSFDICPEEVAKNKDFLIDCPLVPLSCHDLLHIEWNVNEPFQAPFLYPVVGDKNPAMHLPVDFIDLSEYNQKAWQEFCRHEWTYYGSDLTDVYRLAQLVELLCTLQGKKGLLPNDIWKEIEQAFVFTMGDWYYAYYGNRSKNIEFSESSSIQ